MPSSWPYGPWEQLLRCPALALDAEKNLVSACGIFSGGVLYTLVAAVGGPRGQGIFGNLFYFSGLSLWILCLILAAGGVSRAVLQDLGGGPRMGLPQVLSYLRHRWKTLVLIPLVFCGLALAGILAQTFMAIAGSIPAIGPVLYALSFALGVAFSLLAVLATLVHILGLPLYPAALGSQDAGVAAVIRELLELIRRRPGPILLVEGGLAVACGAAGWVIATLLRISLHLTVAISQPAMLGERFQRLVAGLPEPLAPIFEWMAGPVPIYFLGGDGPAYYPFAGFLMGMSFLALLSAAFAYPFTLLVTGGAALYVSLRSTEGSANS
jgi:hypothetical protein